MQTHPQNKNKNKVYNRIHISYFYNIICREIDIHMHTYIYICIFTQILIVQYVLQKGNGQKIL